MSIFTRRARNAPPATDRATTPRPTRGRAPIVGVLEPGQQLGGSLIPPGHCAIGFLTAWQVFVHVEPRDRLLELLDELRDDLVQRRGWGDPS